MKLKQCLKYFMVNLGNFLRVIWDTEVNVGQTDSFHDQRIKDAFPEAVISFGRFRLFSGKYWSGVFLSWIEKRLDLYTSFKHLQLVA